MTGMNGLHLGALDLNLIVALDALLEERSVTRAAARVGITQSAMSHALARLRVVTGDELLVRGRGEMVPTSRGEELRLPLRRALEELSRALARPEAFDPAKAERRVRVATSDYCEIVLLPRLLSRLDAEAPGIELRVVPYHDDVPGMLAAGEADVVLAPVGPTDDAPGIFSKKLFDETFVCVVRRGHPLASKRLTAAAYAGARHALISPRGKEGGFVDDALAKLGLRRRVVVTVPHFLVAPHVVASCDLVLTLASRVATLLAEPLGLVVLGPPADLRLAGFRVSSIWHERTHGDPAHAWLRGLIADVAVGI